MALKFKSGVCKVSNLKYHRNGKGENSPVPLDVKLEVMVTGKVLDSMLGGKAGAIWSGDRSKDLALPYLGACQCTSKFNYCQVNVGGAELKDATMSKIAFTPLPGGQVDMTFNLSVDEVSAAAINKLRQLLQQSCEVSVTGGDLVVLAEGGEEEEGEEQQELLDSKDD